MFLCLIFALKWQFVVIGCHVLWAELETRLAEHAGGFTIEEQEAATI
jgi:hypothetical protein